MASIIKIKSSAVPGKQPNTSTLDTAELAINTSDQKMYSANGSVVFEIGSNLSSLSVTTSASLATLAVNGQSFPTQDGGSGQILKTYGNGTLYWTNEAGASGFSAYNEYIFTANAGQTNFAGNDDDGQSLGYREGGVQVFLNGILIEELEDYTANNGANIVLTSAASANDIVQIFAYNIGSSNNITIAANNNIGINNTSPSHVFSVNGNTYMQANVTVNDTLLDGSDRAFKVYYANGDVAWG